jgi:cell division protein FtsN
MAARRGKSQARRNGSNGLPGWAWLVIGVLVTLAVVLAVPRLLESESADGFFRPRPNPDAQPAATNEDGEAIAPDTATDTAKPEADKPKQTQYDFYTLLPGEGVQVSDAELAASAKAEAEAQAKAAQQDATATATPNADGSLPSPIAETPAAMPVASTAPATSTASTTAAATASSDDSRYLLQAGAFGASGDAETVKAKIAMLGLNARVESAQIGGKTVYRVRMGPYGSASELADAKAKLSGGGLPAMAVKTN